MVEGDKLGVGTPHGRVVEWTKYESLQQSLKGRFTMVNNEDLLEGFICYGRALVQDFVTRNTQ